MDKLSGLAYWINGKLPIYMPKSKRGLFLAVWNCGDIVEWGNFYKTFKNIRITIRRNGRPVLVIKKGAI